MIKLYVIITGYNTSAYVEQCIQSVRAQADSQTEIDWTDDCSTDDTWGKVLAKTWPGIRLRRTLARMGALYNILVAQCSAEKDSVVVQLDGDDYLLPGALERVREIFSDPNIWVMHANYTRSDGGQPWGTGRHETDDFRNAPCKVAGLRAWRAPLLLRVLESDFQIGGFWQTSGWDNALMLPLLELAGIERVYYEDMPLSVYRIYEANDAKDKDFQEFCSWYSRKRQKYSRLENIEDTPTRTPHVLKDCLLLGPDFPPNTIARTAIRVQ